VVYSKKYFLSKDVSSMGIKKIRKLISIGRVQALKEKDKEWFIPQKRK